MPFESTFVSFCVHFGWAQHHFVWERENSKITVTDSGLLLIFFCILLADAFFRERAPHTKQFDVDGSPEWHSVQNVWHCVLYTSLRIHIHTYVKAYWTKIVSVHWKLKLFHCFWVGFGPWYIPWAEAYVCAGVLVLKFEQVKSIAFDSGYLSLNYRLLFTLLVNLLSRCCRFLLLSLSLPRTPFSFCFV